MACLPSCVLCHGMTAAAVLLKLFSDRSLFMLDLFIVVGELLAIDKSVQDCMSFILNLYIDRHVLLPPALSLESP